ncbi:MAG: Flp family type IVb pilin [Alphaproteobacteria bacterium]|nr:Flp family type IVb pilin [Alphaproteobacteria bacterium]
MGNDGTTSIEYCIIAALISVVAILAFMAVTDNLSTGYYHLIAAMPTR